MDYKSGCKCKIKICPSKFKVLQNDENATFQNTFSEIKKETTFLRNISDSQSISKLVYTREVPHIPCRPDKPSHEGTFFILGHLHDAGGFKATFDPVCLFQVVDEHVLHTDMAAVYILNTSNNQHYNMIQYLKADFTFTH